MTTENTMFCPVCRAVKHDLRLAEPDTGSLTQQYQLRKSLSSGEILFEEGSVCNRVYGVHVGEVKLSRKSSAAPQVLRLVAPGQVLGHRAALTREPYSLTAQATGGVEVCTISLELFNRLVKESPDFATTVLTQLAETLRDAEDRIVSLAHDSVRRRCAKMLLYLRRGPETADTTDNEVRSGLRRLEMAQMIGTTPDTLSRTLHSLARQRLIEISRTNIRIIDPNALERIANTVTAPAS